jgi:MscS family membrane protein
MLILKIDKIIKVTVCFLLLVMSFSSFSASSSSQEDIIQSVNQLNSINAKLFGSDDEAAINRVLKEKVDVLDKLMMQLRKAVNSRLFSGVNHTKLDFLASRIVVNTDKGHQLAAERDKIKLEEHKANQAIKRYLEYLIASSKNYRSIEDIVNRSQVLLDDSMNSETKLVLPEVEVEGKVFLELKSNYQNFLKANNSYQDILNYVINNPRKITSVHWFQEFSLISAIVYVNQFDFLQPINHKLAPFKVDAGGILLSVLIYFLVYFSYPFVFRYTRWCVEKFVIDKASEQQESIYFDIRKPARTLLLFFGINLGTYALFYKTDYRSSLEDFSFIIYSIIYIWLFFKIIDSIVLVRIQKLSSSNRALRKELFNLGVQSAKGFVVVIILAFGLNHFGISLTAIMSTLGVGGLAFALAAKDTLSNLFGGMTILFDNVFRMGDWVKVGDVEGTVAEIGLRSTTIRTFDNALITIPNSLVSVSSVMNWNRRAVGRRIKMHIGVTYESNMDDLRQGLEDIRTMLREHPDIANPKHKHNNRKRSFKFASQEDTHGIKSTQLVFMDRYNDFSIDILIYCFARTVNWEEWLAVKEDVLFKIAEILKKNNLEFAYPTQVRIHRPENKRSDVSGLYSPLEVDD